MVLRANRLVAAALTTGFLLSSNAASAATNPLTGYSLSTWAERDGVPLASVFAIAQDAQGYLWLGTKSGLVRFDGFRFLTAEALELEGVPGTWIRSLLVDADGMLWIGAHDRGLLRLAPSVAATAQPLLTDASVSDLAQTRDGVVWAATDQGLFAIADERVRRVVLDRDLGTTQSVFVDSRDQLWIGTSIGLYRRGADGGFTPVGDFDYAVSDISQDREGVLWTTHPTLGFTHVDAPRPVDHVFEGLGTEILIDSRDNLWVGTRGQGLWRVSRDEPGGLAVTERASVHTGLVSDGIWAVFEDREGNIWVGTVGGLHRLMRHRLTPVTDLGLARGVAPRTAGGIWVGTASGLLKMTREGAFSIHTEAVLNGFDIRAFADDGAGTVWFTTAEGTYYWTGRGQARPVGDTINTPVQSFAVSGTGAVWAVDAAGRLLRARAGRLLAARLYGDTPSAGATGVFADGTGPVWLATADGGLYRIADDGMVQRAGMLADPTVRIRGLAHMRNGTLVVGGDEGLSVLGAGQLIRTGGHGLLNDQIQTLVVDAGGALWLAVGRGLLRVGPDEIALLRADATHRPEYRYFTMAHGVAGVPTNVAANNGATLDRDGTLWVLMGRGVTMIDTASVSTAPRPTEARAHIEGVVADERRFPAAPNVTIPSGTHRLQIDYSTLQLSRASAPRFRYRLVGFDPGWIDSGTQHQTIYANLPPGSYQFLVQAESESREGWSKPTTVRLVLQPAFHQTFAFYALIILAAVGLGWLGWQARLRMVRREFAAALAERARLSRELHDTLLQGLVGFALQLDVTAHTLGNANEGAYARLVRMRVQMERYIRDIRQSIWELRSDSSEGGDFIAELRESCSRLSQAGTRVELRVRGAARKGNRRIEDNLLRICQEAMTNAVRHARASTVIAELGFEADAVSLLVTDDGAGFDADDQLLRAGHYGIISMRERAASIGGTFTIRSTSHGGTIVEVRVLDRPLDRPARRVPEGQYASSAS